jgi:hypothetical protein
MFRKEVEAVFNAASNKHHKISNVACLESAVAVAVDAEVVKPVAEAVAAEEVVKLAVAEVAAVVALAVVEAVVVVMVIDPASGF